VKGVVVDEGHRGLALEVMFGADLPHWSPSTTHIPILRRA
jgi:hypothetical protein